MSTDSSLVNAIYHEPEYRAVCDFYRGEIAERSGEAKIKHIDDGLKVLDAIYATDAAKKAFCLRPLFQNDAELITVGYSFLKYADPLVILLVMEYRNLANDWLSTKVLRSNTRTLLRGRPVAGTLVDVRHMLIADKVQGRRDFERHHRGVDKRSNELGAYFKAWLLELGVEELEYKRLCDAI